MEESLKEDLLLSLCGLDVDVPETLLPFENLVNEVQRFITLNRYDMNMRLAKFYRRVVAIRRLSLEEIYLVCDEELKNIEAWYSDKFVFNHKKSKLANCILNAEVKRFIDSGSAFNNGLVSLKENTEFDSCQWNDKFIIGDELCQETKDLVFRCGRISHFSNILMGSIPEIRYTCNEHRHYHGVSCEFTGDWREQEICLENGSCAKESHAPECSDSSHNFLRIGFLSMRYHCLNKHFNETFLPLIEKEMSKIHRFVFLADSSRVSDVITAFEMNSELCGYPFKLKFGSHTLKDQIFKILSLEIVSSCTPIEFISIDIESPLKFFFSKRIFSELVLIFRYLFGLTYLGYYASRNGRHTLFLIVSQVMSFYQLNLILAGCNTVDECISTLNCLVEKALAMFGMTNNEILNNLDFIDCGMCYIYGKRRLSDVLALLSKMNVKDIFSKVQWSDIV